MKSLKDGDISCCDERKNILDGIVSDDDSGIEFLTNCHLQKVDENCDREDIPVGSVFDTHCHLEFIRRRVPNFVSLSDCLEKDGEELGDKFLGCIVNYCQPSEWSYGPQLDRVSPLLRSSAGDTRVGITLGCHPHFADHMTEQRWSQLELLVSGNSDQCPWLSVVAVGECGLDYSPKNTVPKDVQKKVFARQIQIAMRFRLPIVLHIRDAEQDGLEVLAKCEVPADYPMHRHCFGGNSRAAQHFLTTYPGSKIGVTGLVTYPYAKEAQAVIRETDMDKILLETDSPYLIPHTLKHLSNCNLPTYILIIAKEVARLKGISVKNVIEKNYSNAAKIYKIY